MDNLAHTLAGAALGEAGLKRLSTRATSTLLIAANLPDIDVVALPFGHGLSFRRGWTHGILAIVVLPILLTLAVMAWDRWRAAGSGSAGRERVKPAGLLIASVAGVFSHPLLDWLNDYGVRWLMPFDRTWFYGDALFIVDPWVWIALALGIVLARRARRPGPAIAATSAVAFYAAGMLALSAYGRFEISRNLRQRDLRPTEVMVAPTAANPNRWRVVISERDRYLTATLRWLPRPRMTVDEITLPANQEHPVAQLAADDPAARRFLRWSRFPFFDVQETPGAFEVTLDDARYAVGGRSSWAAVRVRVPDPSVRPGPPSVAVLKQQASSPRTDR